MFSSNCFIGFAITFRSLIHTELIFVCGVRQESSFILLHVINPAVPATSVEENIPSPLNYLGTLVKDQLTVTGRVYFWILNLVYWSVSVLMSPPHF